MWNLGTNELAASCELTGVHLDRAARKAIPFSDAVRAVALAEIAASGNRPY
jgi:acyl-CoA thioester hydrolase